MIKTLEELKRAYPDLVEELEEEIRREIEEELLARLCRLLDPEAE
jgi:hypothetical protein